MPFKIMTRVTIINQSSGSQNIQELVGVEIKELLNIPAKATS